MVGTKKDKHTQGRYIHAYAHEDKYWQEFECFLKRVSCVSVCESLSGRNTPDCVHVLVCLDRIYRP